MPVLRPEGRLLLISLFDLNEVVCSLEVKGSKLLCSLELVSYLGDEWKWVVVLDGDVVELLIVDIEL